MQIYGIKLVSQRFTENFNRVARKKIEEDVLVNDLRLLDR